MVFYFGIAALTIALAALVEGRQGAKSIWGCRKASSDGYSAANGCRAAGGQYVAAGGGSAAVRCGGLTRRRALDYVCLFTLFMILAGLAALRIEVGNDYGKYVENFHEIWAGTDSAYVVTEIGFNFVVWLVYTLSGYENYLLVFALFGAGTAFLFLKAMDDESAVFGMSFAMFMLLGVYFRTFTTVRYYFALAAALYAIRFIRRREYVSFCLWIIFAALFHKSALLVIPLYLMSHLKWRRWFAWALVLAGAFLFVFRKPILELALQIYPTYRDTVYLSQDIGIKANASGIVRCLLVFLLALACGKESREDVGNRFYLKLNFLGLLAYTCGSFLPLVSRIAYYAVTPQLFLVPGLLCRVRDKKRRKTLTVLVLAACLLYFLWFLKTASGGGIRVLPYKTWIFTDKEWINGADFF